MPFQSVPDVAEAVVRFTVNTQPCTMTFYGELTGGYTQSDIDNLATLMDAWATAEFLPVVSSTLIYTGVNVKGLELLNDLQAFDATGTGAGAVGEAPMPNALAIAVTRRSALSGRSARGRVFWPLRVGMIAADENFILGAAATQVEDALNEISPAMIADNWVEVIVSRFSGGAARTTGVTFPIVSYGVHDFEIDTQRRRMPTK